MFVTGPNVVKTVTHEDVSFEELGGAMTHASKSGVAHYAAENEPDAIRFTRELLGFVPLNNMEDPPFVTTDDPDDREEESLNSIVPVNPNKPYDIKEVIHQIVDDGRFLEIHSDFAANIVVGFARLGGYSIGIIANQPAVLAGVLDINSSEKAARFVRFCDAFNIPIITFVDVPGAHPGAESEERGIAESVARSIALMTRLRTPIVTVITGEGGSGGALAIAVGDVVIALENAVYSVISPEGCASILWRTSDEAPTAALAMKMTAADQQALGVIDIVVPEPAAGAHAEPAETARRLKPIIVDRVAALAELPIDQLVEARYQRYRVMGSYTEAETPEPTGPVPVRGLGDRLRDLLGPGRRAVGGAVPNWTRDEPPARALAAERLGPLAGGLPL